MDIFPHQKFANSMQEKHLNLL